MEIQLPGGDLVNPLASQFGHLSVQDKAFLDAFNRQEQQELHGVPRPGPVDPHTLLGQLEQVTSQFTQNRLQRQGSLQSSSSDGGSSSNNQPRHHEIVEEVAAEEVRWFYKREVDKDWTPFMGYDSLRIELRYRHIWQTKWSDVDRRTNTLVDSHHRGPPRGGGGGGPRGQHPMGGGGGPRGRRARSLNRVHYDGGGRGVAMGGSNGYGNDDDDYLLDDAAAAAAAVSFSDEFGGSQPGYYASSPSAVRQGYAARGRHRSLRHYRSADNFSEAALNDERDMHIIVRGGVYEVDLCEWKCHSIYWPGEAFDILRGTWFNETSWQPVQCEYADRIEQEHLQRFLGHKMADYVWDSNTSTRLEKQVHHTTSFPEFHVDWMSPEEVYLHRENTSSQIYRGISASLGFKKPQGYRLFRGYKELCQPSDRVPDINHIVFVVHGVGQVVDDTTIIRNTNLMRDNVGALLNKHFPNLQRDTGQRVEFFPVEWRSSLRLDEGMVKHITPQRIMGLRNLLNSSAMDIMYYTSPLYRMEIWQTLQEELNRIYEMFVQRNPYFEANGGKVSIVAHSLGCVVTYDILTGWTQDVEHSWYNLQTRGGGGNRRPGGGVNSGSSGSSSSTAAGQSGLLFRIENFFCLGSPLSVFLTLRWRDPSNQEYHDHILPRSLCKYLYNIYHPCDPVAYRVEPVFMKFYSKVEPVHLHGAGEFSKMSYSDQPLQPLQNARKDDDLGGGGDSSSSSSMPVNIANGHINISMSKMLPSQMPAMSPSISLPKMPHVLGSASTTSATVNGAMNQMGQAAGGLFGGVMGLVKDAAAAVTPGSSSETTTTTTTKTTTTRPGMPPVIPPASRGAGHQLGHSPFTRSFSTVTPATVSEPQLHQQPLPQPPPPKPQPSYAQEVKLPDGQRLAYRMDYILRETGNTYIAAVTSHTSYWSNPDVAYFMLSKLHPEVEFYKNGQPPLSQQQPLQPPLQQQQPLQQQPQPQPHQQHQQSVLQQQVYQPQPPPLQVKPHPQPPMSLKTLQQQQQQSSHYGIPQHHHQPPQQQHMPAAVQQHPHPHHPAAVVPQQQPYHQRSYHPRYQERKEQL